MTEAVVAPEQVVAPSEADDFWISHAWSDESLDVFGQAMQEWDSNQPSHFIVSWSEFLDCAAIVNPAWLPPVEYAVAVARLAYAKQNQVSKADAEAIDLKTLAMDGWLPLTIAEFDPAWVDDLEKFPYLGSHLNFALLNPTLTSEAISKIVNRKNGASFLLDHSTSFMWLNAAKHSNTPTSVLMRLAFRMVPSYRSFYQARVTDPSFRLDQIENRIDGMFSGDYLLPGMPRPKRERTRREDAGLKWERDMDKKIAAALLSREDLPWAARKFLEFKGYKATLPAKCSARFSPAFAQAYVASLWSETQWMTAPYYHLDAIPNPSRGSIMEGRATGAALAPIMPGRSDLAKYLIGFTSDWLTPESRSTIGAVSHRCFAYLGGLLALVRQKAEESGFENADNIPLEWLLELNPLSTQAEIAKFIESVPAPALGGTETGRQEASELMKQYESQVVRASRLAHSPHSYQDKLVTLADVAGEYFYGAIKLSRAEGNRHA